MKNKDIIFWTDIEGLPEIEPVTLSQNFIPEWFQKAPSFHSNQPGTLNRAGDGGTIKICPSFGDYFKMGYVVSLWCDLYIDFENEAEWQWRVPNNKYNFDLHPSWQYKDHLTEEAKKNPNFAPLKVFDLIGYAKTASSPNEAKPYKFLLDKDSVVINRDRLLHESEKLLIEEISKDYKPPKEPTFKLPGASVREKMYEILENLYKDKKILDHGVEV